MTHATPASAARHWQWSILAMLALGTLTSWCATQGGLTPRSPGAFAAEIYLTVEAGLFLAAQWAAIAGFGYAVRLLVAPRARFGVAVQLGGGLAVWLVLIWALALAGQLNRATSLGAMGVGVTLLLVQVVRLGNVQVFERIPAPPWTVALWAPGLAMLAVACTCPPSTLWAVEAYGYDVLSYHLQLPREWIELGRMAGLEHNVYSYLPNLVEASYMHVGVLRGSMHDGIYWAQALHGSMLVTAAVSISCTAAHFVSARWAAMAGALLLITPWSLITGSSAYNEAAVLALGAVALMLAFDPEAERWRGAALIGLLCGAATLSKLTAGPMVALPIGLLMLTRLNHAQRWRLLPHWPVTVRAAAIAAVAGTLTLAPYFVRNATWTGNPAFPFAANVLGSGHWDQTLVERWNHGHGLQSAPYEGVTALRKQWLVSAGFGAIGGAEEVRINGYNIARFRREGGVPVLWLTAAAGLLLGLIDRDLRRFALALLVVLAIQLAFWLMATHLQSRFLIPTLLPGCALATVALARIERIAPQRWVAPLLASGLMLALATHTYAVFVSQTARVTLDDGQQVQLQPFEIIGSVPTLSDWDNHPDQVGIVAHPINDLPRGSRVYLVADVSRLLYLRTPVIYHTAFDRDLLGEIIRRVGQDPAAITAELRALGATHVWVHWSELQRLHDTYGYDRDVTAEALTDLATRAGWEPLFSSRTATLFDIR